MANDPLVIVEGLQKLFPLAVGILSREKHYIHAVDEVTFSIAEGESLALVGESGSGKTTTGKLLVKLTDPTGGHIKMRLNGDHRDLHSFPTRRSSDLDKRIVGHGFYSRGCQQAAKWPVRCSS